MNINSLKVKIFGITMIPFIIGIFILSSVNFSRTQNTLNETLKKFEVAITKEKEALIKHEFEVAKSMIDTIIAKEQDIEVAKLKVIELLNGIRYLDDKSGYFFAYEKREDGYYFGFHPNQKLNNQKTDIKAPDAKGYPFREDLIKYAKEQKYITYYYENPTTKEITLKMASSIYIAEFNWVLVTGIYADDIKKGIDVLREDVNNDINKLLFIAVVITIIISIGLILIIVPSLNKIIIKPLNIFQNTLDEFFRYLNAETQEIHKIENYSKDEFGQMAKVLNTNIDKAKMGI